MHQICVYPHTHTAFAQGKYEFKMLAVDVPSAAGGEQRLFLEGDETLYNRGGILNELRDPFLRVLGLQVRVGL